MYNTTDVNIHGYNERFLFLLNKNLCALSQVDIQISGYPNISFGLYIMYEILCIFCLQHSLSYLHLAIRRQRQFLIRGPPSS